MPAPAMADPGDADVQRAFALHLVVAVATLGLYMPVWLAQRDETVRERVPDPDWLPGAWALGAGTALGLIARGLFGDTSPRVALGLSLLAVVVFLVGFYQVSRHAREACEVLGLSGPLKPAVGTAAIGLVFLGVELGNEIASWWVRGPVVALVLGLPYVFWRLHVAFETIEAATPDPEPADEAASASTS